MITYKWSPPLPPLAFTDRSKAVLLLWIFYVFSVLCLLCLCERLFVCALWSPAGKRLTSWHSCVVSNCAFVTFPLVSWIRCGTWLYRFLTFAPLLTSNMRDLGWKVKGQHWPSELIYSHCHIRFNISNKNNDFGFNSFQKINFSKIFAFRCIMKQIWPWRKLGQGQPRIIISTNLVGPTFLMLHTKS